jgi:DnaK suppressor protein
MDDSQARILLSVERARVEELLHDLRRNRRADRLATGEQGDMSDSTESFVAEGTDDAIALGMARRLEAIERAELRLDAGTYGHSVESGVLIPDERLEADPAAELTVEEALGLT